MDTQDKTELLAYTLLGAVVATRYLDAAVSIVVKAIEQKQCPSAGDNILELLGRHVAPHEYCAFGLYSKDMRKVYLRMTSSEPQKDMFAELPRGGRTVRNAIHC